MSSSALLTDNLGGASDEAVRRPPALPPGLRLVDWGRTVYSESTRRQMELWEMRAAEKIPDTLIFTEHASVFTLGARPGARSHLVWNETQLREAQVAVEQSSRGGDITYHGPGQIVGYPIVSLHRHPDLHAYLRFLEEVLINTVGGLGMSAERRPGLTGIWIGTRKVAAIGIAVKRWVAYHGFALNVNVDLSPYEGIVPCGICAQDGGITSLAHELGHPLDLETVKECLFEKFSALWSDFLDAEKTPLAPAAPARVSSIK